jgi:hypothetical protein
MIHPPQRRRGASATPLYHNRKIIFISLNHTSVSLVKASRRRRGALRKSAKTNKDILP